MLVLTRKKEEVVHIQVEDVKISITLVSIKGNRVQLGFDAPKDVIIRRAEVKQNGSK